MLLFGVWVAIIPENNGTPGNILICTQMHRFAKCAGICCYKHIIADRSIIAVCLPKPEIL